MHSCILGFPAFWLLNQENVIFNSMERSYATWGRISNGKVGMKSEQSCHQPGSPRVILMEHHRSLQLHWEWWAKRKSQVKVFRLSHKTNVIICTWEMIICLTESSLQDSECNIWTKPQTQQRCEKKDKGHRRWWLKSFKEKKLINNGKRNEMIKTKEVKGLYGWDLHYSQCKHILLHWLVIFCFPAYLATIRKY